MSEDNKEEEKEETEEDEEGKERQKQMKKSGSGTIVNVHASSKILPKHFQLKVEATYFKTYKARLKNSTKTKLAFELCTKTYLLNHAQCFIYKQKNTTQQRF